MLSTNITRSLNKVKVEKVTTHEYKVLSKIQYILFFRIFIF